MTKKFRRKEWILEEQFYFSNFLALFFLWELDKNVWATIYTWSYYPNFANRICLVFLFLPIHSTCHFSSNLTTISPTYDSHKLLLTNFIPCHRFVVSFFLFYLNTPILKTSHRWSLPSAPPWTVSLKISAQGRNFPVLSVGQLIKDSSLFLGHDSLLTVASC